MFSLGFPVPIQYRKSRIREMKEDEYTKSLAKNQVCAIFHMRDIGKNVLPKFYEALHLMKVEPVVS